MSEPDTKTIRWLRCWLNIIRDNHGFGRTSLVQRAVLHRRIQFLGGEV